jgi:hypothetical protein|nr:MAG TPA: hypothetical protein [Bacteriophage sp.]
MKKQLIKCGKFAFIDISKAEGLLIQPSFEEYAIVRITYNDEVSTANIYKVETKELLTQFILELDETCISDSISLPSVTDFIEWFDEERDNFITMLMEEDDIDEAETQSK